MHARLPGMRYGFDFYDYYALQWKWREDSLVTKICSLLCGLNKRPWQPCVAPTKAPPRRAACPLGESPPGFLPLAIGLPCGGQLVHTAGPESPSLLGHLSGQAHGASVLSVVRLFRKARVLGTRGQVALAAGFLF